MAGKAYLSCPPVNCSLVDDPDSAHSLFRLLEFLVIFITYGVTNELAKSTPAATMNRSVCDAVVPVKMRG